MDFIPEEVMHQVAAFLTPREIHRFFVMTSKDLRQTYADAYPTWRQILGTTSHDILLPMLVEYGHDKKLLEDYNNPRSPSYAKMARDIAGMEKLSMGHWRAARYRDKSDLFSEQEAHSSVLLTSPCKQKKYLAVVPGWGKARKEVEVFDVSCLPYIERVRCRISGNNTGYFKYGHSSTKINDSQFIVFGGLTSGGYRAAINILTLFDIHYNTSVDDTSGVGPASTNDVSAEDTCERDVDNILQDIGSVKGMQNEIGETKEGDEMNDEKEGTDSYEISSSRVEHGINVDDGSGDDTIGSCNNIDTAGASDTNSTSDTDEERVFEGYFNTDEFEDVAPAPLEMNLRVVAPSGIDFYSNPRAGVPTSRGYHTACAINICKQDYLLIWGGLGNRLALPVDVDEDDDDDVAIPHYIGSGVLTSLECMNCSNLQWHTALSHSGVEPSPRFGHSCTYHPRTNSLIIIGGSDGTDLVRNGEELREVYMLTIVPPNTPQECNSVDSAILFNNVSFVWSHLRVDCSIDGLHVPGRCHSVSLVSRDKLLIFGGSAFGTTNAIVVMDITQLDSNGFGHGCYTTRNEEKNENDNDFDQSLTLYAPTIFGEAPTERLSSLCAHVGKYFLIQGGYEPGDRGCLSDCWMMDMSYSTAPYRCEEYERECYREDNELGDNRFAGDVANEPDCVIS